MALDASSVVVIKKIHPSNPEEESGSFKAKAPAKGIGWGFLSSLAPFEVLTTIRASP
ncbi:hypothetical protein GCM10009861_19960 [Neomicrococcus aestuarii]